MELSLLTDGLALDGYLANTCPSPTFPISAVYRVSSAVEVSVGGSI